MWRGSRQGQSRTHVARATKPAGGRSQTRVRLDKSKVAQQRVKKKALIGAVAFTVLVSFFGAVSWASFLDVFAVQSIAVSGTQEVRERAIESELLLATASARLGLFSQQNMLLYPREILEQQLLETYPRLHSVTIDKQLAQHAVHVTVEERQIWARWCELSASGEDVCYHVDSGGFIFEPATPASESLVTLRGGLRESRTDPLRARIAPQYFEEVTRLLADLKDLSLEVHGVIFMDEDAAVLIAPKWELRVALDKDLGATAFNLRAVLDEQGLRNSLESLEYIDMRFDERVYFKHRNDSAEVADKGEEA